MESFNIGHATKYMRIPLGNFAMLKKVIDQHAPVINSGSEHIGAVEHFVGKQEISEKHDQCQQHYSKYYRNIIRRTLKIYSRPSGQRL